MVILNNFILHLDYRVCRKEKKLQTAKIGRNHSCLEYRTMGKLDYYSYLANKCFYLKEEEFVDVLLDRLDARRNYADWLEQEGSVMAKSFRERESIFRLRNNN